MKTFWKNLSRNISQTLLLITSVVLIGCASAEDLEIYSEIIDNMYMVETQKKARDYHYRIVEADGLTTMRSAEEALINLGIPVTGSDLKTGEIFATTSAPHPLTTEEWKEIIKVENPRVKKISKGVFILPLKPVGSFIDLKLTVRKLTNNTTMINIAYSLRNPKIDALGLRVPRLIPSQAAIIGSQKIWDELNKILEKKNKTKIRKPTVQEFTA